MRPNGDTSDWLNSAASETHGASRSPPPGEKRSAGKIRRAASRLKPSSTTTPKPRPAPSSIWTSQVMNSAAPGSTTISCRRRLKPGGMLFFTSWFHAFAIGKTGGVRFCAVISTVLEIVRSTGAFFTPSLSARQPVQSWQ